jgi:spermidine synthase
MRRLVLAIFVLSGAAGLVYEVVWARQLVLVFGNTTQAVSAILTGFFGGMAIGSAVGGRIADRVQRTLRLYGILEIVLVVIVLATPITFRLLHEVYRGAFGSLETAPLALALVRFVLALVALGPATILMGATLPTLTRHLSAHADELSASFGRLYAANTIGAILGAGLAGFFLIEWLGLSGTLFVGAACSGIAGVLALTLDRVQVGRARAAALAPRPATIIRPPSGLPTGGRPRLAIMLAFVSGLTALAYQVLWTRLIASGTGNSTYVFSLILVVFLLGLALGAMAFNVLRTRLRRIVDLLAAAQIAIAVLAMFGMLIIINSLGGPAMDLTQSIGQLVGDFTQRTILVVLPATFIMGLSFPAASALVAGEDEEIASRAGLLLAANTFGAIVGTFVVPFLVIPLVGSPVALGLIAIVNALTGIALAFGGRIEARLPRLTTGALGAVVTAAVVVALVGGRLFIDPSVARIQRAHGVIQHATEDEIAAVQAGTINGSKQLWVTGTSMTLLTVDAKLMPVLPLILRPASKAELTIAFGMGSAFRASLVAGMKSDAVELVPSVPTVFGDFYPDAQAVLANPNGRVIIADGRNHVELTDRTYDIIVVDPPPPIESSGVSVISCLEFYQAARARLTVGGVMMQWVPYGQTLDEFKAHVRTFRAVFAHVIVAQGPGGYGFFMFGSDQPIDFDEASIREVLARPGILADMTSAFDSPKLDVDGWVGAIPQLIRLSGDQVSAFAGPGPLITDDRPLPEYFFLRHWLGTPSPRLSPDQVHAP